MNDCVIEMLYDKCISWIDGELSSMNKTERMKLYDKYRWMFASNCKQPDLESLIIGVEPRVNTFRSKFREWFFVSVIIVSILIISVKPPIFIL